jgi:hypothetical protein
VGNGITDGNMGLVLGRFTDREAQRYFFSKENDSS